MSPTSYPLSANVLAVPVNFSLANSFSVFSGCCSPSAGGSTGSVGCSPSIGFCSGLLPDSASPGLLGSLGSALISSTSSCFLSIIPCALVLALPKSVSYCAIIPSNLLISLLALSNSACKLVTNPLAFSNSPSNLSTSSCASS